MQCVKPKEVMKWRGKDVAWYDGFPEELKRGMLIEEQNGRIFLVGDVNIKDSGSCGCCARWEYGRDWVKSWCQLLTEDDLTFFSGKCIKVI